MTRSANNPDWFTGFDAWVNKNSQLDSWKYGLTSGDIDKMMCHNDDTYSHVIILEIKSMGVKSVSNSQLKMLKMQDKAFRMLVNISMSGTYDMRYVDYYHT